jgi:hypothetical protein
MLIFMQEMERRTVNLPGRRGIMVGPQPTTEWHSLFFPVTVCHRGVKVAAAAAATTERDENAGDDGVE